ncbi:MAG: ABC transporter permease [Calditrichaeota bacterium]|nr:MAG: ABC transporter permease [Calditrichota bacterium]
MKNKIVKLFLLFFGVIYLLMIIMGIVGKVPPNYYHVHQNNFQQYLPASKLHILGTSYFRKDIFTEFIFGAKSTFYSGILALIPFLVMGILLGVGSTYQQRPLSRFLDNFLELLNSIPKLIGLLIFIGLFGNRVFFVMAIFGILSSPKLAELIKGKILSLQKEEFIDTLKALGLPNVVIILKHILWYNCKTIIISQMFFIYAAAVLIEASLSYVQLGFSQESSSWGYMLYEAQSAPFRTIFTFPWNDNFHTQAFVTIMGLMIVTLSMFYLSLQFKQKDLLRRGIQ